MTKLEGCFRFYISSVKETTAEDSDSLPDIIGVPKRTPHRRMRPHYKIMQLSQQAHNYTVTFTSDSAEQNPCGSYSQCSNDITHYQMDEDVLFKSVVDNDVLWPSVCRWPRCFGRASSNFNTGFENTMATFDEFQTCIADGATNNLHKERQSTAN